MKTIGKTLIATFSLLVIACKSSQAQFVPSNYEVGINFGSLVYQGDLSSGTLGYTKSLKPAIGVFVGKSLSEYFSVRANLNIGKIGAYDTVYSTPAYKKYRALNFSTPVTELSATLVWNILGEHFGNDQRKLSPYFFAGAGLAFFNVKRDWSHYDTAFFGGSKSAISLGLGMDTLHKTPSLLPILPIGFGIKYMVAPQLSINAEATYRIVSSDYLDGFSQVANPKHGDYYYGVSMGISYKFGRNKYDCPKAVR